MPPLFVRFESTRRVGEEGEGRVGMLRFNVWMTPIMPRMDDAMVAFRECRGVVMDLRGNVGGVAAMVMGMGGYFLDSTASFGTMTMRGGALRYVSNPRRSDRRMRSPGWNSRSWSTTSVSTSEIFAAGLQAMGGAKRRTAGGRCPCSPAPNGDVMQYVVADFTALDGRRLRHVVSLPRAASTSARRAFGRAGRSAEAALRWINGAASAVSDAGRGGKGRR
jgi:carboxyl-terminal processing protease